MKKLLVVGFMVTLMQAQAGWTKNEAVDVAMGMPMTPSTVPSVDVFQAGRASLFRVPALSQEADLSMLVFVTNRDSGDVAVIDSRTDKVINRVPVGTLVNAHMSMSHKQGGSNMLLVAGTQSSLFYVANLSQGIVKAVPTGQSPEHFGVTSDGKQAYVANFEDGSVSVIDLEQAKELARIPGFFNPHGVTFHPRQPKAYVPNEGAHEVGVIDMNTKKLVKRIAVGELTAMASLNPDRYLSEVAGIHNVVLTIDGRHAYAADGDSNQVAIIDTEKDEVIKTIEVGENPWQVYGSPDGKWMFVPNNGDETVTVIDAKSHRVVATLPGGEGMTGVNFANDNQKAYVIAAAEATVLAYDLPSFRSKRLVIGKNIQLETASTTPDGKKIYLASSTDNSVYVIDAKSDLVTRIPNVGQTPWGVDIHKGYNYCH